MQSLAHIAIEIATTILVAASMAYCLLVLFAAISFRLYTRQRLPKFTPAVTILKLRQRPRPSRTDRSLSAVTAPKPTLANTKSSSAQAQKTTPL